MPIAVQTLRMLILQVIWLVILFPFFYNHIETLVSYWALAAVNLWALTQISQILLQRQRRSVSKSYFPLLLWLAVKLVSLALIFISIFRVQDQAFNVLLAGLSSLIIVPLLMGIWSYLSDGRRYV